MIKAIIIDDEQSAVEHLLLQLKNITLPIQVVATLQSVKESVEWLRHHPSPDIVFMETMLMVEDARGVFDEIELISPVVYTLADDNLVTWPFWKTGIGCLRKPVTVKDLDTAIHKYNDLKNHFLNPYRSIPLCMPAANIKCRKRILVKKEKVVYSILLDDVYIFTVQLNHIVLLITKSGARFTIHRSLRELAVILDPEKFCRINKQCIVHIGNIEYCSDLDKGPLQIQLYQPDSKKIIIREHSANLFKKWFISL